MNNPRTQHRQDLATTLRALKRLLPSHRLTPDQRAAMRREYALLLRLHREQLAAQQDPHP
jgi:hypothetical protein